MSLETAFEQFIQAKTVMNISEESIKHYQFCFKYFKEFFGDGRNCEEVTEQTIFDYLAHSGYMSEFKITLPRAEETIFGCCFCNGNRYVNSHDRLERRSLQAECRTIHTTYIAAVGIGQ